MLRIMLIVVIIILVLLLAYLIYSEQIFSKINMPKLVKNNFDYPINIQIKGMTTTNNPVVTIQHEFARFISSLYIWVEISELKPHGKAQSTTIVLNKTPLAISSKFSIREIEIITIGVRTYFIKEIPTISFL